MAGRGSCGEWVFAAVAGDVVVVAFELFGAGMDASRDDGGFLPPPKIPNSFREC